MFIRLFSSPSPSSSLSPYAKLFADHDFLLPLPASHLLTGTQLRFSYLPSVFTFSRIRSTTTSTIINSVEGRCLLLLASRLCLSGVLTLCNDECSIDSPFPMDARRRRVLYLPEANIEREDKRRWRRFVEPRLGKKKEVEAICSFASHWLDNRLHRSVIIAEIKWSTSASRFAVTAYPNERERRERNRQTSACTITIIGIIAH